MLEVRVQFPRSAPSGFGVTVAHLLDVEEVAVQLC